jgi:hypothetical protein
MSLSNLQVHLFFYFYHVWCIGARIINLFFKFEVLSQLGIEIMWLQYMNALMRSELQCSWAQFSRSLEVCPSSTFFLATPLAQRTEVSVASIGPSAASVGFGTTLQFEFQWMPLPMSWAVVAVSHHYSTHQNHKGCWVSVRPSHIHKLAHKSNK